MICDTFVFREEVKLCLDSMVFLIQEVNLILQLCHSLFVHILLVLHTELLYVLATCVFLQELKVIIYFFDGKCCWSKYQDLQTTTKNNISGG